MRLDNLPVFILQQIRAIAVQHARPAQAQRRRMLATFEPMPRGLHTDQAHRLVRDVRMKNSNRVGAAADAGDDRIGLASGQLRHLRQ